MIPTDARLEAPIYLDTTTINWITRRHKTSHKILSYEDLYFAALADFARESLAEQRILRATLKECIHTWKSKANANRTAFDEIAQLDGAISTVWAKTESIDPKPRVFVKAELLQQLDDAGAAFEHATHLATIRLKAIEAVMIRRAMHGRRGDAEPPLLPAGVHQRQPLSKTDWRNYEVILQLEHRAFHSPTQYFREIGQRCVTSSGKPVGHATINGWFKKEGLYDGRKDNDIAALQMRAVARAKKVLAEVRGDSQGLEV